MQVVELKKARVAPNSRYLRRSRARRRWSDIRQVREQARQGQLAHRQRETATRAGELDEAMQRLRMESAELKQSEELTVRREDRTETAEHRCSASIGVVMFAALGKASPEDLHRQADGAMYRAKAAGGNTVHVAPASTG